MQPITETGEKPFVKKGFSVSRVLRYTVAVIASIVLFSALIFGYSFYRLSATRVFNRNYRLFTIDTPRTTDARGKLIDTRFTQKHYKEATILADSSGKDTDTFIAAMSWIELDNHPKALDMLKKLMNKPGLQDQLKEKAEFYLALLYIRNKDFDQALEILDAIRDNPRHSYRKKASPRLIRQVRMLKWR
jgi:predicted negative regulator of RcsB-dependent stress response